LPGQAAQEQGDVTPLGGRERTRAISGVVADAGHGALPLRRRDGRNVTLLPLAGSRISRIAAVSPGADRTGRVAGPVGGPDHSLAPPHVEVLDVVGADDVDQPDAGLAGLV